MKSAQQARIQYLKDLIAAYAAAGNRNRAVEASLARVEAMDESQFAAYEVRQKELAAKCAPTVARMASSLVAKFS